MRSKLPSPSAAMKSSRVSTRTSWHSGQRAESISPFNSASLALSSRLRIRNDFFIVWFSTAALKYIHFFPEDKPRRIRDGIVLVLPRAGYGVFHPPEIAVCLLICFLICLFRATYSRILRRRF